MLSARHRSSRWKEFAAHYARTYEVALFLVSPCGGRCAHTLYRRTCTSQVLGRCSLRQHRLGAAPRGWRLCVFGWVEGGWAQQLGRMTIPRSLSRRKTRSTHSVGEGMRRSRGQRLASQWAASAVWKQGKLLLPPLFRIGVELVVIMRDALPRRAVGARRERDWRLALSQGWVMRKDDG